MSKQAVYLGGLFLSFLFACNSTQPPQRVRISPDYYLESSSRDEVERYLYALAADSVILAFEVDEEGIMYDSYGSEDEAYEDYLEFEEQPTYASGAAYLAIYRSQALDSLTTEDQNWAVEKLTQKLKPRLETHVELEAFRVGLFLDESSQISYYYPYE